VVFGQSQSQDGRGNPSQTPGATSEQQRGTGGQSPTSGQPGDTRANSTIPTNNSTFISKAVEINSAEIQLGQLALKNSQDSRVKTYAEMMVKDHSEALQKFRVASTSSTSNASANSQNRSGETAINSDDQDKSPRASDDQDKSPRASSDLPELSRQHQQLMTRLEKMKGSQFDREYLTAMVNGHRDAVRLFEQEAGINSSDRSTASKGQTGASTPGQRSSTERGSIDTAERTATSNTATNSMNLAAEMLPTIKNHLQEAERLRKTVK